MAAIYELLAPFKIWDESDWNIESVRDIEEKGPDATQFSLYRAGKSLGEKGECNSYLQDHHTYHVHTM